MTAEKIIKPLLYIYHFITDLLFPPRCVICNNIFAKDSFITEEHICHSCRKKLRFVDSFPSLCKKCSCPIGENDILCLGCQVRNHKYNVAFSCVLYENEIRRSLLSYKFYNARHKYRTYARIMLARLESEKHLPSFDFIVSVPLSKNRMKQRKFDHVAPLAKYISYAVGVPYIKNALFKIKETPPQSRLSFNERFSSVKGAYTANKDVDFKGKSILLIDDIYTTGATVDEISYIMKKKGAEYVTVLTLCIRPDTEKGKNT